jgi:POT family proton-dependent oligopeptide transporter
MGLVFALGVTAFFIVIAPLLYMQMRPHPNGLKVLFFAEMWERFSYYGMRALLIFYLTWHFLVDRSLAYQTYAAYVALVYLAPLMGGYLADKYIGFRKGVTFGAILLVAGHSLMTLHGQPATETFVSAGETYQITRSHKMDLSSERNIEVAGTSIKIDSLVQPELGSTKRTITYADASGVSQVLQGDLSQVASKKHKNILYLAMALIVVGVGFLKPNISTCVGALYEQGDERRDTGFTLYYLGINIGAALSSIWCGYLAVRFGWSWGFGLAAIGMIAGLIVFIWGQGTLEGKAEPRDVAKLKQSAIGPINFEWSVYLAGLVMVGVAYMLFQYVTIVKPLMHGVAAIVLTGIIIYMLTKLDKVERDRMIALLILVVSSVLFWTLFDQGPSTLNIFAADYVSDSIGPLSINAPQLQSLNPLFIVVFGMAVAALWTFLGKRGKEPNAFVKFGLAMIQIGLGFWVLNWGIKSMGIDANGDLGKVAIIWVALMYFLHTTGELCLSPVGLSNVTKLSPKQIVGFMMGAWFLASSYANILAGIVAGMTVVPEGTPAVEEMAVYSAVFFKLGLAAVVLGGAMIAGSPYLKRLTHGR